VDDDIGGGEGCGELVRLRLRAEPRLELGGRHAAVVSPIIHRCNARWWDRHRKRRILEFVTKIKEKDRSHTATTAYLR